MVRNVYLVRRLKRQLPQRNRRTPVTVGRIRELARTVLTHLRGPPINATAIGCDVLARARSLTVSAPSVFQTSGDQPRRYLSSAE